MASVGPLRRVLEPDTDYGALYGSEPLECGHWITLSQGWSYAARRKCAKCYRAAWPDFDPKAPRETWDETRLTNG